MNSLSIRIKLKHVALDNQEPASADATLTTTSLGGIQKKCTPNMPPKSELGKTNKAQVTLVWVLFLLNEV